MTIKNNIPAGYKDSAVGIIPQEWEVKHLAQLGKIFSGGTPSTDNQEYWGGDIMWCTPTDITNLTSKYIEKTKDKITTKGLRNSSATLLPVKSIIVCTRATIGNAAITCAEITTNQGFKNIVPQKCNSEWLYYAVISNRLRLQRFGCGSTFAEVSKKDFEKFKLAIPPMGEQRKIAEILEIWDEAIEKQNLLIEKLELRKRAIMQRLLTGKTRLPGFTEPWQKVKLGEIAQIKKGKSLTYQYVKCGIYPVIAGGKDSPYSHNEYTDENVVTISASGAYAGYISYYPHKIWASDCSVVKEMHTKSNIIFLYNLLLYNQLYIYSLQVGGAQPHVFPKDIERIKLLCPSLSEQKAIAEVLSTADKEIAIHSKTLDALRLQKRGLMQQLLTGKTRVKI